MRPARVLAALLPLLLSAVHPVPAQERAVLRVAGREGASRTIPVSTERGYRSVAADDLTGLGWSEEVRGDVIELRRGEDTHLRFRAGNPFFRWGRDLLQLVDPPYLVGGRGFVPLQLVTDFFPARLPGMYRLEAGGPDGPTLRVGSAETGAAGSGSSDGVPPPAPEVARVVIVDPGHGGRDAGAIGPDGIREKDVALAMARALVAELEGYPGIEVHLTRDADVLVPLWQRGEWATETKGERPGVFISLHANALPSDRSARGFETYFLSEARNDHERRVAALENAPLALEREEEAVAGNHDLDVILRELRNLDHQHWSALLAELIQARIEPVHPGPDRGVKQGPFAVITNAIMPAVLVETGFISNPDEEHLLARSSFQRATAHALAEAVVDFFQRYPPGRGTVLAPSGNGDGTPRRPTSPTGAGMGGRR